MKTWLSLLLLGTSLCATATPAAQPQPAPSPRSPHAGPLPKDLAGDLRYRFDLHDPTRIHVSLTFRSREGADILLLPSEWAGETELFRAVSGLHAITPETSLTPSSNPARWLLRSDRPGRFVSIAYDLVQDWTGPLKHPFEHRAILGPTLFEFTGQNGLVAPALAAAAPARVTFDFAGLQPAQALITSFGSDPHQRFRGPWSEVRNALFTGGALTTRTFNVDGRPVLLGMHGSWSFSPEDIISRLRNILATERHLWNDTAIPFYAIVIAPYEDPTSGGGGSSFTDVFNLFLADRQNFSTDTASLVAHEAFHQWNPSGLGTVADTGQIAWFGEGFTRFFQDAVLERAGLIQRAEYLDRVNATLKEYLLSPRIRTTNADLQVLPSTDHFSYQEPYLRGSVIAIWLDYQIAQQTDGRHTLMDLLLALRANRSLPLTADRIFATAGRFVDPATVARLRAFALDGVPVPISPGSLGPCVAFHERSAWTFDLGFDAASLHTAGIVRGVQQGSNAWQAGVRDGQQLGGFSLWNGNPEREVTLTLRETDGKLEKLSFLPRGKLLSIPQAEQIPGCTAAPSS